MELLDLKEVALRLHCSRSALYTWLAQSRAGTFKIGGEVVTIRHHRKGQGRILIPDVEIERLLSLMEVSQPRRRKPRRPNRNPPLLYITGELGRPEE